MSQNPVTQNDLIQSQQGQSAQIAAQISNLQSQITIQQGQSGVEVVDLAGFTGTLTGNEKTHIQYVDNTNQRQDENITISQLLSNPVIANAIDSAQTLIDNGSLNNNWVFDIENVKLVPTTSIPFFKFIAPNTSTAVGTLKINQIHTTGITRKKLINGALVDIVAGDLIAGHLYNIVLYQGFAVFLNYNDVATLSEALAGTNTYKSITSKVLNDFINSKFSDTAGISYGNNGYFFQMFAMFVPQTASNLLITLPVPYTSNFSWVSASSSNSGSYGYSFLINASLIGSLSQFKVTSGSVGSPPGSGGEIVYFKTYGK